MITFNSKSKYDFYIKETTKMSWIKITKLCIFAFLIGFIIALALNTKENNRKIGELKLQLIEQDKQLQEVKDNWIEVDKIQNAVKDASINRY